MSSRSVGRVVPTKGFLIRLRERVSFLERGVEALKMKRDQLVKEAQALIKELKIREEAEKKMVEAYEVLRLAYATAGPSEASKAALLARPMRTKMRVRSVIGVEVPEIEVRELEVVTTPSLNAAVIAAAEKMAEALNEIIKSANVEARFERIAESLAETMRKVNALEKLVIPEHKEIIKYIEEMLEEEGLEEFLRVKKYKSVKGRE
ncbi:MAG TPA: V-type ATP synthase subunit D [Candidatus Korarchaeota archaeon]|nr:V-type ATP synthase subunit D [Candidatus Korarchaeota archaeon]